VIQAALTNVPIIPAQIKVVLVAERQYFRTAIINVTETKPFILTAMFLQLPKTKQKRLFLASEAIAYGRGGIEDRNR
jgi:hypothetical protein